MTPRITDDGTRLAFLTRLIKATEDGSLEWKAPDGRINWFVSDALPFSYVVHAVDRDDQPPFELQIFKYRASDDPEIGTDNVIETWTWDSFRSTAINERLEKLYVAAGAQVKGVGNLAEEMFRALAALDGGPAEPYTEDIPDEPTWDRDNTPF